MTGESGDSADAERADQSPPWIPRKEFKPSKHLHLVREIPPEPKPGYLISQVFCVGCQKPVFLIHLDLPPEDPKK